MPSIKYLESMPLDQIEIYGGKKADPGHAVAFTGSPRKHPFDPDRIILIARPFSTDTEFYEFRVEDITFAEVLPQIINDEGQSLSMARIWIRKKATGLRYEPFCVDDELSFRTPDGKNVEAKGASGY
jgi:inorganic pyrophosphatase